MEHREDVRLDAIPFPAFILRDGRPESGNRAAREMFPGWQPGGLPAALEQLLGEAEDPSAGLAGCCMAEGKDCQVTLSPRTEGEQLLCVVPRGPGAGGPALEQLGSQLRECLGELHLSAQRLGQPLEQLQDRRWDGAYFTLQRGLYRLLRMTRHLELLQQLDQELPEQGALDLADLCAELTGQAEVLSRQAGVELYYESRLLTLPTLGSAPLLEMLLLNLLSNGIKAAGRGGTVTLRLSREGRNAVLAVEDSGGAGQADLTALFQEGASPLRPGAGLGLGLTLVRRIALAHEGTVLAVGHGGGTRVTVFLPLRDAGGALSLRTPTRDAEGGFPPVLVELSDVLPSSCYDYSNLD